MSIRLNTFIDIISTTPTKDAEGFTTHGDTVVTSVRAYKETRSNSADWERIVNNAAFSTVTAIFRFRVIPSLNIDSTMVIAVGEERYNIINVQNIKGRNMYLEVLAAMVVGSS
jgi:head-tail adaptor